MIHLKEFSISSGTEWEPTFRSFQDGQADPRAELLAPLSFGATGLVGWGKLWGLNLGEVPRGEQPRCPARCWTTKLGRAGFKYCIQNRHEPEVLCTTVSILICSWLSSPKLKIVSVRRVWKRLRCIAKFAGASVAVPYSMADWDLQCDAWATCHGLSGIVVWCRECSHSMP